MLKTKNLLRGTAKSVPAQTGPSEDGRTEELLSFKQLAEKLDCSVSYLKKLRNKKIISPEISFSRFIRFRLSAVIEALQRRSFL